MIKIFLLISLTCSAFVVNAQSSKPAVKLVPVTQAVKPVVKPTVKTISQPVVKQSDETLTFGANLYNRVATQVEKQDTGNRTQYLVHEFIPYVKYGDFRLEAMFDYYNFYDNTAQTDWDNSQFLVNFIPQLDLGESLSLHPQLIIRAPLFKNSSSDFQGSAGARVMLHLNSKALDAPDLILRYGWQVEKFSQKFEVIKDANNQFVLDAAGEKQYTTDARLRQRLLLGYMLTDKLMAMIYFHFDSNLLFDGSFRNGFYHETFLEYTITSNFYINGGLTNGGGLFVGDFQEKDNLKLYSKESSEYFAGIGFNF